MFSLYASLVRGVRKVARKGRVRSSSPSAPHCPLSVERLEDRTVPTSITEYGGLTAGAGPFDVCLGPDGNVWFTEPSVNKIGRLNVATGQVDEFPTPTANSRPTSITPGPDGRLWFTESNANKIGRITTAGVITAADEFSIPTAASSPSGITAGPDGRLWFTETASNKIGRITTAGVITAADEFVIPTAASQPAKITAGPDGNLWFTQRATSKIARITTAGAITTADEFPTITANAGPFGITTGPDGKLWFTMTMANKIGRIPTNGVLTAGDEFTLQTTGGVSPSPVDITAGPDGNLWFTEFFPHRIVQMTTAGVLTAEFVAPTAGGQIQGISEGPHSTIAFVESGGNKVGVVHDILDANHEFVRSLYQQSLGRNGFPAELDHWVGVLVQSGSGAVVSGIENSAEARTRVVKGWYTQFLGRTAMNGEEQGFAQQLIGGMTEEQVLNGILGSQEYFNRAPQVPGVGGGPATDQTFVQALYVQFLNRVGGASEINGWVSLIPSLGRAGVAGALLGSAEYRGIVVRSYYTLILHRPAPPAQAEVDGWVNSGLDLRSIRLGFEGSLEFFLNG